MAQIQVDVSSKGTTKQELLLLFFFIFFFFFFYLLYRFWRVRQGPTLVVFILVFEPTEIQNRKTTQIVVQKNELTEKKEEKLFTNSS